MTTFNPLSFDDSKSLLEAIREDGIARGWTPMSTISGSVTHADSDRANSLVIVALPAKDDYVHKISSEKVPHMTLLFLGEDVSKVKNLSDILTFTQHAAKRTLTRFGMEVERRGILGEDEADVLFFSKSKWSGFETIRDFRSQLLKNDNIRTAYDSADQFPEWLPHLTLGYPDSPAKEDDRDYPGISHVSFDRIAVWFGNYEGIEFPLDVYDWSAIDVVDSVLTHRGDAKLAHFGVKGMKWGVRKDDRGRDRVFGGVLSEISGRPEQRRDEQWRERHRNGPVAKLLDNFNPMAGGWYQTGRTNHRVSKATHKAMKSDVKALNKHPEFNTKEAKKAIKEASKSFGRPKESGIAQKYYDEHYNIWKKHLIETAPKFTDTSPSGEWETYLWVSKSSRSSGGMWSIDVRQTDKVKHADTEDFVNTIHIEPVFDDDGYIVDWILLAPPKTADLAQSAIHGFLEHYGVKGMKWGVRRSRESKVTVSDKRKRIKTSGGKGLPADPSAVRARVIGQKAKGSGLKALSDAELREYANRIQLEQNVKRLQFQDSPPTKKFILKLLGQTGQNTAQNAANDAAAQGVKKAIKIAARK